MARSTRSKGTSVRMYLSMADIATADGRNCPLERLLQRHYPNTKAQVGLSSAEVTGLGRRLHVFKLGKAARRVVDDFDADRNLTPRHVTFFKTNGKES